MWQEHIKLPRAPSHPTLIAANAAGGHTRLGMIGQHACAVTQGALMLHLELQHALRAICRPASSIVPMLDCVAGAFATRIAGV